MSHTSYFLKWRKSNTANYFSNEYSPPLVFIENADSERGWNELEIQQKGDFYELFFNHRKVYRGNGEKPSDSQSHIVTCGGELASIMNLEEIWKSLESIICREKAITFYFNCPSRNLHNFFTSGIDMVIASVMNLIKSSPASNY